MSFPRARLFISLIASLLIAATAVSTAQTFRGGISGRVVDDSGGVLPGVTVTAVNTATGISRSTTTSATGDFSLPDLPLGPYSVEAALEGFRPQKATVEVSVSKIVSVNLKMGITTLSETVQVSAAAITLDTVSTALSNTVRPKQVQDLPLNGRDFRRMLQLAPGVTQNNSVNGVRTRGNNFQIDGADNNDAFQNNSAVNQGGVSGIPGTLLPVEAIDQFAVQSAGGAEQGRNAGSSVNLVIKSGTNDLHGSAFYFNRNEKLAKNSPVVAPGTPKRQIRNNQFGGSLGGPIAKNKAFFFGAFEGQKLIAGNTLVTTVPSQAWMDSAKSLLDQRGLAVNPVALSLLALWPKDIAAAPGSANNYLNADKNDYDSFNYIGKIDHTFNAKHSISGRYFTGTGQQVAYDGSSPFTPYYQAVPSRMRNMSIVPSTIFTSHLLNQLVIGYNYFYQTFNTDDTSANPTSLGLNTGVTDPALSGAPIISINGFGSLANTSPAGRVDATWHFTDTVSYSVGAHQFKFGGEYRRAKLNIFYDTNKRGNFTFDGTVGGWPTTGTTATQRALADYLAGFVATGTIVRGPTNHDYYQNSFDVFVHDSWTARPGLTINFGVRYTNPGILGASDQALTNFIPSQGLVSTDKLYPNNGSNLAPRVGFAYSPWESRKTVFRGSYGRFYDVLAVNFFTANTSFANGGALGVGHNPGGAAPVYTITQRGFTVAKDVSVFGTTPLPPFGAFAVSQDLRLPWVESFTANVEHQLTRSAVLQVGYVGTRGHNLALTRDINAPVIGTTGALQARRPFNAQFPTLGAINELETVGRSEYNALQMSFIQGAWHGLSGRMNYTFGHAMDNGSEARNTLVMNAYDVNADWGDADFDVRHIFTAGFTYELPFKGSRWAEGWQVNTISQYESGLPFNVRAGTDVSLSGDRTDRVDLVGDPFAGVVQPGNQFVRFFNPAAFAVPAAGTFGNLPRNKFHGPAFRTVDISVFKTTKLGSGVSLQARCEIFNVFNVTNWALPGATLSSSTTFGLMTNTRNGSGAPGIGSGEPRNVQLAMKLLF